MLKKDGLIRTSRFVVRVSVVLNRCFLAAVTISLLLSLLVPSEFGALLLRMSPAGDVGPQTTGLRWMMAVGIVMGAATERLLLALGQIIESARAGDPFPAANANRLRSMGWALLVLQLLDIPAYIIERFFPTMGMGTPDPMFSIGGWMAVLMVFVLSRVFAVGSAMREDLQGTV